MKIQMIRQVAFTIALAAFAASVQADPILGTGFTADVIAEKEGATPDDVTDYDGLARWVYAEEGSPDIKFVNSECGKGNVDYLLI